MLQSAGPFQPGNVHGGGVGQLPLAQNCVAKYLQRCENVRCMCAPLQVCVHLVPAEYGVDGARSAPPTPLLAKTVYLGALALAISKHYSAAASASAASAARLAFVSAMAAWSRSFRVSTVIAMRSASMFISETIFRTDLILITLLDVR